MPYLRAKAGIAFAGRQSTNAMISKRKMLKGTDLARTRPPLKLISFDQSIRPSSHGDLRFEFSGESLLLNRTAARPTSALLPHTAFIALSKGVNERIIRGRWQRSGRGGAH